MGGWGKRERVAGQETSSADEVIGLKIKRWRHLKPIPVNELSGAPGGKEETARAGRWAPGGAARPPAHPAAARARSAAPRPVPATRGGVASRSVPQFGDSEAGFAGAAGRSRGCPRRRLRGLLLPPPSYRPPTPPAGCSPRPRCAPTGTEGFPRHGDPDPFPPPWAVSSGLTSLKKRKQ